MMQTAVVLSVNQLASDERFHSDVADLLDLPELHASRERVHHFDLTEFDHLMQVAQTAHRVSRFFRADARTSARAGLLHDLGAHWFNTVKPVALAVRLDESHGVRHAIRAHTVLPVLPRTREAWAVVAADFITTARECQFVYRRVRARAGINVRTRLVERTTLRERVTLRPMLSRPGQALRHRLTLERRLALQARLSPFAGLHRGPYIRDEQAAPLPI
ncbi:MAG TPA: HD domain-containing protein [Chloroflexota bacterium]|nr:HD domain-containing protein [Chloroflexota bacterium]